MKVKYKNIDLSFSDDRWIMRVRAPRAAWSASTAALKVLFAAAPPVGES